MTRAQANVLIEILSDLTIGDNTIDQPLQTVMDAYYRELIKDKGNKKTSQVKWEADKRIDLLHWKIEGAFRKIHLAEAKRIGKAIEAKQPVNEREYLISEVAKKHLNMSQQNLNQHLRNHPDVKVRTVTPRKRYLSETELTKLKQILGITQ